MSTNNDRWWDWATIDATISTLDAGMRLSAAQLHQHDEVAAAEIAVVGLTTMGAFAGGHGIDITDEEIVTVFREGYRAGRAGAASMQGQPKGKTK